MKRYVTLAEAAALPGMAGLVAPAVLKLKGEYKCVLHAVYDRATGEVTGGTKTHLILKEGA
jgi:hypothetical protein